MIATVKGLWGDHTLNRRNLPPPSAFESVLRGVRECAESKTHVDRVYAFGKDNAEFLRSLGYDPIVLSTKAWAAPERNKRYNRRFAWNGAIRRGYSYWWHKLRIMEVAATEFPDGVLWTDFDVIQKRNDTAWLFEDLYQGRAIRASLYAQHNWTWGAGWRHKAEWLIPGTEVYEQGDSHTAARTVMGCGFLYLRSLDLVKYALEIQDEFPHFLDHQVITLLFDRLQGGEWIGTEEYVRSGWHTQGYYYGRQLFPPRMGKTCFQSGRREKRVSL